MTRPSFRTKLFLASLSAAIVALVVAGVGVAESMRSRTDARIQQTLVEEARLVADLLARGPQGGSVAGLDDEADRIGHLVGARVTLIGADGRVVGDSAETPEDVGRMENHANRPEVVDARAGGIGRSRRHSATLGIDMLYVAVAVRNAPVAFVRLALPLTEERQQLNAIVGATLLALSVALAFGALFAWIVSGRLGERVRTIARVAQRYRAGDLTPARIDYGDDELGAVARALDESVQELGRRVGELARDRGRMEAILAGMVEGVIVVDPQRRVQLVNDAARRMLKLEGAAGRPYIEMVRHPAIADLLAAALAGTTPEPLQFSPPRDSSRILIARAAPTAPGAAHGAVVVLHDITDLRRADQVRRDFVANVSHELRTPLTAIRGYVEALSEGDADADESRRFLQIIARHTARMERLVQDLLRLARLDAGQETADLQACATRTILDGVIADLGPALSARHQRVTVNIGADAERIVADAAGLQDALRNLVSNAITYAPEHSAIAVDAARDEAGRIVIAVADEGPGIPDGDLPRIFERFYRVEKSRARHAGGTGLGLAIVRHLVELQGGSVRAENRAGGGARFVIELRPPAAP